MATIWAMFANPETSSLLYHCDQCLKEALHLVGSAAAAVKCQYSDGNSQVAYFAAPTSWAFPDPQDVAFALSSDGAQLWHSSQ